MVHQNLPIVESRKVIMKAQDATLHSDHALPIEPPTTQENMKRVVFVHRRRNLRQSPSFIECSSMLLLWACALCVNSIVTTAAAENSIPILSVVPLLSNNLPYQSTTMRQRWLQNLPTTTPYTSSPVATTAATTTPGQRHAQEEEEAEITNNNSFAITAQQRDPSCAANPGCAPLQLQGACCPTVAGMLLDCCLITVPPLTALPSQTPTSSPTQPPTTAPATPQPTTLLPTEIPTLQPTTNAPTTSDPTFNPTATPSIPPTEASTTFRPSLAPSNAEATVEPTTPNPSASSTSTTDSPTIEPTQLPTGPASYQFAKMRLQANGVRMNCRLQSRRMLRDNASNCTEIWRNDLQNRVDTEIRSIVPNLETLQVNVFNASTYIGDDLLVIIFNILVEIRSPPFQNVSNDMIIDRFIQGPFDSPSEEKLYIVFLRSTGCPQFVNVTGVDFVVPRETEQQSTSSGSVFSTGLVSALAAAVGVIIIVGGTLIFMRVRNGSSSDLKDYSDDERVFSQYGNGDMEYAASEMGGGHEYASEIGVRSSNPDVSTLGDPIPFGAERARDDLSSIGSTSLEYDYQKAFADAQSCANSYVAGSTTNEGASATIAGLLDDPSLSSRSHIISLPRDDDAFRELYASEETFEVLAPPGLLGLVLQSSVEDGRPAVHSIKPRSVLADVVRVGDRLVSVDDEDVTIMRASDVSQLIAEKKNHEVRRLVFSRPAGGTR